MSVYLEQLERAAEKLAPGSSVEVPRKTSAKDREDFNTFFAKYYKKDGLRVTTNPSGEFFVLSKPKSAQPVVETQEEVAEEVQKVVERDEEPLKEEQPLKTTKPFTAPKYDEL